MVSTCMKRSRAQARQVVESCPPEKRTRAERVSIVSIMALYHPQPFVAPQRWNRTEGMYPERGEGMFVSDILAQKGGLVFTVTPGTTVAQVAQQLSTRRIGSVLVLA